MVGFLKGKVGKRISRSTAGNLFIYFVLLSISLFSLLPLVYAIATSLKPMEELFIFPPRFFVRRPTLDNFGDVFNLTSSLWVPFSRYLFNSVLITASGVTMHVLFASMAAYPLAKNTFPGSKAIFNVVILALLFVPQVTFLPQYIILHNLKLVNTYGAVVLPAVGAALGLFLMKQFMENIPMAMLESARIDGANEIKTCFNIVMPIVKPAWLTLIVLSSMELWNGTSFTQRAIYSEQLKGLTAAIQQITASSGAVVTARTGVGMAGTVITMIPMLLLFSIVQSGMIETMAHAGIKE